MTTRSKAKGTAGETAAVRYVQTNLYKNAVRPALHGPNDIGDIAVPRLVFEVKLGSRLKIPQWLNEAEAERVNAKADYGILLIKPVGIGLPRVGEWWAMMRMEAMVGLLRGAGYGDQP